MGVEAARLALRPLGDHGRTVPAHGLVLDHRAGLPRQDERHRRPRRAPPRPRRGRRRRARLGALGRRRAARRTGRVRSGAGGRRPIPAPACPTSADEREGGDAAAAAARRRRHRRRAGAGRAPRRRVGDRGVPRPVAHARRSAAPSSGRSASARLHYVALGQRGVEGGPRRRRHRAPRTSPRWWCPALHARAVRQVAGKVGVGTGGVADDLTSAIGNPGAAQPALLLAAGARAGRTRSGRGPGRAGRRRRRASCSAPPRRWRRGGRPARSTSRWPRGTAACATSPSCRGRAWSRSSRPAVPSRPGRRRRPRPATTSGSSASSARATAPPARCTCRRPGCRTAGGSVDDMAPQPMADAIGTVVTFTVDRLAYSPSPPIVFAVVDFDGDGGGRLPMELTDVDAADVDDRRPGRDDLPPAATRPTASTTTSGRPSQSGGAAPEPKETS